MSFRNNNNINSKEEEAQILQMNQAPISEFTPQLVKYGSVPSDGEYNNQQISSQVGGSHSGTTQMFTPFKEDKSFMKDNHSANDKQINQFDQPSHILFLDETKRSSNKIEQDKTAFPSPISSMTKVLNQNADQTKEIYIQQGDYSVDRSAEGQDLYGKTNNSTNRQEESVRVVNGIVVRESKNKSIMNSSKRNPQYGHIMDKWTLLGCILMLIMNVATLSLFGALLAFEFLSVANLNTKGYSDEQFVFRSLINASFQDCFLFYRVAADFFLIILLILFICCAHYPLLDYARNIIFYAGFACSTITFTRTEYLLYLDSYSELKASLVKYQNYQYQNESDFKTNFDNYYIFLKAYSYAMVLSSLVHIVFIVSSNSYEEDKIKSKPKDKNYAEYQQPVLNFSEDLEGKRVE